MTAPVRVLIADDEPLARDRLRRLLAGQPEYELVAECGDGRAALEAIRERHPDVALLDVQMPELDGLAAALAATNGGTLQAPAIVFVTAFDAFALAAFETGALDYILKPVTGEKLARALGRVRARLAGGAAMSAELLSFIDTLRRSRALPVRFAVRDAKGTYFVRAAEIEWAESDGNYVRLHVAGRSHLLRETLTALLSKLDPREFVRVHRSHVINVACVARLEAHVHGEYTIFMRDGAKVSSSRAYNAAVRALLG